MDCLFVIMENTSEGPSGPLIQLTECFSTHGTTANIIKRGTRIVDLHFTIRKFRSVFSRIILRFLSSFAVSQRERKVRGKPNLNF
jgi:hypothetical protein